jgi:TonB family protein
VISFDMLLAGAWKSAALLGAAFAAAWILRRGSAALRHFLWTAAFAALLLLPLGSRTAGTVRIAAPAIAVSAMAVALPAPHASAPIPWASYLWMAGAALALARFLAGAARVAWLARHARPAGYAQRAMEGLRADSRVRVLDGPAVPVPLTWGILRPVILLPDGARHWPLDRLTAVLRHELAHIARGDLAAQYLAQACCCLYWFQPLVWLAARRHRRERELACDDAVLATGMAAHEYASHLVEVTRSLGARRARGLNAPAMAGSPHLESRVRALFAARDRRPLRARMALAIAGTILAVGLPVASLHVYAQTSRGALAGAVQDPSGGRVAKCVVTARNLDGTNEETAVSDAAGEYRFAAIPPGRYSLTFASPGFAKSTAQAVVTAGVAARLDANLELGNVTEKVTVVAQKPAAAAAQPATPAPQRVRVGGIVQATQLIYGAKPVYPPNLQQQGIEGTVIIRAIVSKEGGLLNPAVVNTDVDPAFAQAALDAVRQWRYKPTRLNGEPVEVATTISVDFKLGQ